MRSLLFVLGVCLALSGLRAFGDEMDSIITSQPVPVGWSQSDYATFKGMSKKYSATLKKDSSNRRRMLDHTNGVIDSMVKRAAEKLRAKGETKLAAQITNEWQTQYYGFVYKLGTHDIGDHAGIQWMLSVYARLSAIFPDSFLEMSHLKDIYYLAYCLPMVFECLDQANLYEYELHYDRFLGIVGYWVSDIGCMILTQGTGVVMICGFVGSAVEKVCIDYIGPLTVKYPYGWACD